MINLDDYHKNSDEIKSEVEKYFKASPNDYKSRARVAFMAGWNASRFNSYTIKVETDYQPPDYSNLFHFIESTDGQTLLEKISSGKISFSVIMHKLKSKNALPNDSSKRIWHALCMLYTGKNPPSVRSYEL